MVLKTIFPGCGVRASDAMFIHYVCLGMFFSALAKTFSQLFNSHNFVVSKLNQCFLALIVKTKSVICSLNVTTVKPVATRPHFELLLCTITVQKSCHVCKWSEFKYILLLYKKLPCKHYLIMSTSLGGGHIIFAFSAVHHTWFPVISRKSIYPMFTKFGMGVYWVNRLHGIAFGEDSSIAE